MTKKSRAFKLHEQMTKIALWTSCAEDATSREEAQKALRKVAKHSLKLAKLQREAYDSTVTKEERIHGNPIKRLFNFFRGF